MNADSGSPQHGLQHTDLSTDVDLLAARRAAALHHESVQEIHRLDGRDHDDQVSGGESGANSTPLSLLQYRALVRSSGDNLKTDWIGIIASVLLYRMSRFIAEVLNRIFERVYTIIWMDSGYVTDIHRGSMRRWNTNVVARCAYSVTHRRGTLAHPLVRSPLSSFLLFFFMLLFLSPFFSLLTLQHSFVGELRGARIYARPRGWATPIPETAVHIVTPLPRVISNCAYSPRPNTLGTKIKRDNNNCIN